MIRYDMILYYMVFQYAFMYYAMLYYIMSILDQYIRVSHTLLCKLVV